MSSTCFLEFQVVILWLSSFVLSLPYSIFLKYMILPTEIIIISTGPKKPEHMVPGLALAVLKANWLIMVILSWVFVFPHHNLSMYLCIHLPSICLYLSIIYISSISIYISISIIYLSAYLSISIYVSSIIYLLIYIYLSNLSSNYHLIYLSIIYLSLSSIIYISLIYPHVFYTTVTLE